MKACFSDRVSTSTNRAGEKVRMSLVQMIKVRMNKVRMNQVRMNKARMRLLHDDLECLFFSIILYNNNHQ